MGIQKSEILLRINMSADKCENVSFKVSLLSEDSLIKTEVRRFVVPQDCSTSLIYLKEKIRTIFNLGRSTCKVSWRDEDGDDVTIESYKSYYCSTRTKWSCLKITSGQRVWFASRSWTI